MDFQAAAGMGRTADNVWFRSIFIWVAGLGHSRDGCCDCLVYQGEIVVSDAIRW